MKTPWGDLPVRDAHVHFLSSNFFGMLKAADACERLGWEAPDPDPAVFAQRWVQELDAHGVASAVLIASLPGDAPSVAAAVQACPERFHGYFMLNPIAEGAVSSARTALRSGLHGICLFPAMHRYSLHDDRVKPVLDACEDAVIFIHCGVLSVGFRKKLGLPSQFDMRFSNPIDIHGLALQHPNHRFVIPHFGAGYFREALMVCDLCPNVYLDTSSSNDWRRYQPADLSLADVFRRAIAVTGPERLLFGTDSSFFPRGWNRAVFDAQVNAMHQIGISLQDAQAILGGNLDRLLSKS